MSEPRSSQTQEGATTSTVTVTETEQPQDVPTLTLKLRKPRTDRKVQWSTETVDNEHLNRKKSKCCCIYDKPKQFGESSSSESDEECDHCHGHVEKKKKKRGGTSNSNNPFRPPDMPDSNPPDSAGFNTIDSEATQAISNSDAVVERPVSQTSPSGIPQPDSTSDFPENFENDTRTN